MKKWPWKALMRRPLLQRMRMTASQAVGRARLCRTSCPSFTCPRTRKTHGMHVMLPRKEAFPPPPSALLPLGPFASCSQPRQPSPLAAWSACHPHASLDSQVVLNNVTAVVIGIETADMAQRGRSRVRSAPGRGGGGRQGSSRAGRRCSAAARPGWPGPCTQGAGGGPPAPACMQHTTHPLRDGTNPLLLAQAARLHASASSAEHIPSGLSNRRSCSCTPARQRVVWRTRRWLKKAPGPARA